MKRTSFVGFITLILMSLPTLVFASPESSSQTLHSTDSFLGLFALFTFIVAYIFVMTEEFTHLRKSKPVVIAAGIIWVMVAIIAHEKGLNHMIRLQLNHNLVEYAELFLFLLVAMTYVNAMEERLVFSRLRVWLVKMGYSYRQLFWVTGFMSFFLSPIADNLTTALLMCAVVMAVGGDNKKFVSLSCINIVVAANAGGAFSPFGDITTLMVWQAGKLPFETFFKLFVPGLVSYVIPAAIMYFALPNAKPQVACDDIQMKYGGIFIIILFLFTIFTAIMVHNSLHLPPMLGMMTGLGYLNFYAYYLKKREQKEILADRPLEHPETIRGFDIFNKIKMAEWDTLFFFYGVILSVGGLASLGYLEIVSNTLYHSWGTGLSEAFHATPANIALGILSAIVDNIPVMYAVLTMDPVLSSGQWLLITLTTGIGGSMLSIGSAAGVALMGQSRGQYTFFGHLKWAPVIFLGYLVSIAVHHWINAALFT